MKNLTIPFLICLIILLSSCQDSTKKTTDNNTPDSPTAESSQSSKPKPITSSEPQPATSSESKPVTTSEPKPISPSEQKPMMPTEPRNLYIKGGGNEPGWNIKITKETDTEFSFDLIMNYGQDKHKGIFKSSKNEKDKTESFIGKDEQGNEIKVMFKTENCRDDGDFDHNRTITLKMKGNTYMGCGDKK